jgi:hypothetical protein
MKDNPPTISFSREDWRLFFQGKSHQTISLTLSEAYSIIFKFCFDLGLLVDPKAAVASVSYLDVNDLSDTTRLMYLRHSSTVKSNSGAPRDANLLQMLNGYYHDHKYDISPKENSDLKSMLRLCRELENISNFLKMGRNINAHMQNEILDSGFTLQICSAVLRLYEIFDYKRVTATNIDLLRSQATEIILGGINREKYQVKDGFIIDELIDNPPLKSNLLSDKEAVSSNGQSYVEKAQDVEMEVPLNGDVKSTELQRQKLHKIKLEIYDYLEAESKDFDKKLTLLYGSNLSDILAFEPKSISDLKKVLSVKILMSRNNEFIECQIDRFGEKIVGIFL